MHLSPADTEKLLLSVAGMVARDRLARGVLLNHPESVALLSTWVIERAREGRGVADLMSAGREVLTRDQVMPGVAEMLTEMQVEATFPDGRKLVTLHYPIGEPPEVGAGDDAVAAAQDDGAAVDDAGGDPRPDRGASQDAAAFVAPGAVRVAAGTITLNADRRPQERLRALVVNTGDRPIQVGSHLHLPDANAALEFDRVGTQGFRLDIPSGTSIRFEPGVSRAVDLVALRGARRVPGLQLRPDALRREDTQPTPPEQHDLQDTEEHSHG